MHVGILFGKLPIPLTPRLGSAVCGLRSGVCGLRSGERKLKPRPSKPVTTLSVLNIISLIEVAQLFRPRVLSPES